MVKDINLQIEITYDDVVVDRLISSKTTIEVGGSRLELTETQVANLYKALTAYAKADGIEL